MSDEPLRILSVRDIAERLGVSLSRVVYAIEKLDMEPRAKLSGLRVFSEDDLPAIRDMINTIRQPPPAAIRKTKG